MAASALLAIFNCVVIEPAFACKEDQISVQAAGEDHCCFFCHASHHQWMTENASRAELSLSPQDHFLQAIPASLRQPPQRSIFHPPLKV